MNGIVAVVYGGPSAESEVSARSAKNVLEALLRRKHRAVLVELTRGISEDLAKSGAGTVYLATHGRPGEDGTVQGLLELLQIPYTCSGVLASGLCMNKKRAKDVMGLHGLPLLKDVFIDRSMAEEIVRPGWIGRAVAEGLGFPVIVKPNAEGSSVGVTVVRDAAEWTAKVPGLLGRYGCLLAERFVRGREMTAGVLELRDGTVRPLPVMELVTGNAFYDYEAKYTAGKTDFIVPARMTKEMTQIVQSSAVRAFKALGCAGTARVDFIVEEDRCWILEVNTIPGMTATSDLPKEAEADGIPFDELVEIILSTARLHGC
jgi:D-alanine-D-alanine ligase